MELEKMCPHCMHETNNEITCPYCGKNPKQIAELQHQLRPFTILQGKYIVGDVLGEGGFGITYIGLDINLEIRVAIKEFYPNGFVTRESANTSFLTTYAGQNEETVTKWRNNFLEEARSLAKCANLPGVVGVKDFFQENNTVYIVQEYLEGQTLKEYVKAKGGKVSVDELLPSLEPIIVALGEVHAQGLIHRDISPDNIMLLKNGTMKVLDFGAARKYGDSGEKSKSVMLKPGYAPEEQYRTRGKQGPWTDVYALCATIYKCITGVTPVESMDRLRDDDLKMPSALGINISPMQEAALQMGMAVIAENRIQSMQDLHQALYGGQMLAMQQNNYVNTQYTQGMAGPNTGFTTSGVTINNAQNTMSGNTGIQFQAGNNTQFQNENMTQYQTGNAMNGQTNPTSSNTKLIYIIGGVVVAFIGIIGVCVVVMLSRGKKGTSIDSNQQAQEAVIEDTYEATAEEESVVIELSEEDLAALEEIDKHVDEAEDYGYLRDALVEYCDFAEEHNAATEVADRVMSTYDQYTSGVSDAVNTWLSVEANAVMFLQIKEEMQDAIKIGDRINNLGISVNSMDSEFQGISDQYKQNLIASFDSVADGYLNNGNPISRSTICPILQRADETELFDEDDIDDSLQVRYMASLSLEVDEQLDKISDYGQSINLIRENMEKSGYSPLLIFFLRDKGYGGDSAYWCDVINDIILQYVGVDFERLSAGDRRNFIYCYYTYDGDYKEARHAIMEFMKDNY